MALLKTLDGFALVVGGGGGIGSECGFSLAQAGARGIVFADINEENAKEAAEKSRTFATYEKYESFVFKVDITRPESVESMMGFVLEKAGGRLDYAVNAAGIDPTTYGIVGETDIDDFDHLLAVNTKGLLLCLRAQLNAMASQTPKSVIGRNSRERDIGRGAIVNVVSTAAHAVLPRRVGYTASKHAVIGVQKTAGNSAMEYAHLGIRINAVSPAWVLTAMTERELERDVEGKTMEMVKAVVPIQRMADAEEVSDYVAFLCSPSASYINGTSLVVDAGCALSINMER